MNRPLLDARHIRKQFGGVVAVDDVSISIDSLQVQCIIGANGAGKSSLFNILCGASRPDGGEVHFDGHLVSGLPLHRFARIGIARKFQIPSVFDTMTVEDNLLVSVRDARPRHELDARIDEVLSLIALSAAREQLASTLAHGQKQWLEIGMAIMARPRLLLLDEPTAGMTPEETQRTAALVRRMAAETAVVAIEHDMSFVRALRCHTRVMHQGRIIVEGTFEEIEKDRRVRDVYLGRT